MSGKKLSKDSKVLVQFLEGIKRIEKQRFRRPADGLQIDPGHRDVQAVIGPRRSNLQLLPYASLACLELLVHQKKHLWRRHNWVDYLFRLRRQTGGPNKGKA